MCDKMQVPVAREQNVDGRNRHGWRVDFGRRRFASGQGFEFFAILSFEQDINIAIVKQQYKLVMRIESAHAFVAGKIMADGLQRRFKKRRFSGRPNYIDIFCCTLNSIF